MSLQQLIKARREKLGLLPALASPKRVREYKEYLQNDYAAHSVHEFRPMGFKAFCRSAHRLDEIQARLRALGDVDQWDGQEYRDLEREENRYCNSLGY